MSSTTLLDFTALLAPISRKEPTGKNLREDKTLIPFYHQLKDARTHLRTIERQQIQGNEKSTRPDWSSVYDMAINILSTQSKDLEVTAWLIEALLREQGFPGLLAGFSLARQLCEKFWGKLYPLPDEDGLISLVAPLAGLNGEAVEGSLITPIALTPLTPPNSENTIALWQYRQALELLNITDPEKRSQRITAGCFSLEMIERALNANPFEFLNSQRKILQECIQEFQQLMKVLQEKCGEYAPPSSRILAQLNACLDCLNCVNVSTSENIKTAISTPTVMQTATSVQSDNPQLSEINFSREQVLHSLLQAAEFFRTTEPHSPVSYMLERVVRWARTPLPELLKELILDEAARGQLAHLTGIRFE
ncbi:MAG TPA: type VI secretion system protein TssA [Gammaproteobacteria bacterium]|nr:type VI secretion system protein TssA [Gammaproteobacteria bacterium]